MSCFAPFISSRAWVALRPSSSAAAGGIGPRAREDCFEGAAGFVGSDGLVPLRVRGGRQEPAERLSPRGRDQPSAGIDLPETSQWGLLEVTAPSFCCGRPAEGGTCARPLPLAAGLASQGCLARARCLWPGLGLSGGWVAVLVSAGATRVAVAGSQGLFPLLLSQD